MGCSARTRSALLTDRGHETSHTTGPGRSHYRSQPVPSTSKNDSVRSGVPGACLGSTDSTLWSGNTSGSNWIQAGRGNDPQYWIRCPARPRVVFLLVLVMGICARDGTWG